MKFHLTLKSFWRLYTQHDDVQYNDTQHNDRRHFDTKHNNGKESTVNRALGGSTYPG